MSSFEQIVQRAGSRPPLKSIERISESDFVSGFKQIAAAGNPVIFSTSSGMTSVQELKNAIGDFPLKLRNRTFDSAGKYDPRNRSYTESTVADFVEQIESGSASIESTIVGTIIKKSGGKGFLCSELHPE